MQRRENLPRQIKFGWHGDYAKNQRNKDNRVKSSRYTNRNWIPASLFFQISKVANIYFLLITLLAFIPDSPKEPIISVLTLALMLTFLVINDGREDKIRRENDARINLRPA